MRIGCVLMAAGEARRFGKNKLLQKFLGKPLFERALDALPSAALERVVVVTGYEEIEHAAKSRGFTVVENFEPEKGGSRSVKLGLKELCDMDAVMFCVSDQPLLQRQSVVGLIDHYMQYPDNIVALGHNQRRGNPVIFPKAYFDELFQVERNNGGTAVIGDHPKALRVYDIQDERELWDVDTAKDLERLEEEFAQL